MKQLEVGKKSGLKYFDINGIRSWFPCYDPTRHLPEDWHGTAVDILKTERVPDKDRLWVCLRPEILSEKTMRVFAVWCARQVQHLMKDPRSLKALDVAEAYAYGKASKEELETSQSDARFAAYAAFPVCYVSFVANAIAGSPASWAAYNTSELSATAVSTLDFHPDSYTTALKAQVEKLIEMTIAEGKESRK